MHLTNSPKTSGYPQTAILLGLLGFAFVIGALLATPALASSGCLVNWTVPTGSYLPGSTINGAVSSACTGTGTWTITTQPGGILVASGSFTCPCVATTLFSYTAGSSPLTKGAYQLVADFNGAHHVFSFAVSDFVVLNELPLGSLMAVIAPVAGLGLFLNRKKIRGFHL